VYTAEGQLIGEFGEERRNLTPIGQIPKVMKDAVLAIEDARFYEHNGIDYWACCAPRWPTWGGEEPGRVHHHHAGGAQRLPVVGEDLHAQDLRDAARSSSSTS
jgi:hypothetical protein